MAQRICVTGASGQAGRAVVAGLREHGYHVTPTDVVVSRADREDGMLQADRAREVLGFAPAHSWRDHVTV